MTYTLKDIKAMDCDMLLPKHVAPCIGTDQQTLRLRCRADAMYGTRHVPFPFIINRSRTVFPRLAFIAWMEGRGAVL